MPRICWLVCASMYVLLGLRVASMYWWFSKVFWGSWWGILSNSCLAFWWLCGLICCRKQRVKSWDL